MIGILPFPQLKTKYCFTMTNERKYREEKIRELLYKMSSTFSELAHLWEYGDKKDEEYYQHEGYLKDNFSSNSIQLYTLITCYFESLNLDNHLNEFKIQIKPLIDDPKQLFNAIPNDDIAELVSITLEKIWGFLITFEFSQGSYLDKLLKQVGLNYLETILKNTQVILNKVKATPTSETQVYNKVKFVIHSVFRSSVDAKSNFFKCFKKYDPDVLIPELHAAIEYKYADTENKLKTQLDQIAADTKGYTGDLTYQIFYAVFYVTDDFWGIDKFEQAWEEMKFPKNWKAFYVVGKK